MSGGTFRGGKVKGRPICDHKQKFRIKGRIQSGGFLRIFIVAFLLFRAPAGALTLRGQFSKTTGHSLTLT